MPLHLQQAAAAAQQKHSSFNMLAQDNGCN
jgi:hypothetical protein